MSKKCVRLDVSKDQLSRLREEVFCNERLSAEQRRKAVRRIVLCPSDGSRVDLYYEGKFVAAV